jgi:hypothetical protein
VAWRAVAFVVSVRVFVPLVMVYESEDNGGK